MPGCSESAWSLQTFWRVRCILLSVVLSSLPEYGPDMELYFVFFFPSFRYRITGAAMSVVAVVISIGAVLGKINPMQSIVMTVVEIIVFRMSRWINMHVLKVQQYHFQKQEGKFHRAFGNIAVSTDWYTSTLCTAEAELRLTHSVNVLWALCGWTAWLWATVSSGKLTWH